MSNQNRDLGKNKITTTPMRARKKADLNNYGLKPCLTRMLLRDLIQGQERIDQVTFPCSRSPKVTTKFPNKIQDL